MDERAEGRKEGWRRMMRDREDGRMDRKMDGWMMDG